MARLRLATVVLALALLAPASASAAPVTEAPSTNLAGSAQYLTVGPDGALWFTEQGADRIVRMAPDGSTRSEIAVSSGEPTGITLGPDGNIWFTARAGNGAIGRIAPDGTGLQEQVIPGGVATQPTGIVAGPDGALWFTEYKTDEIGRVTTDFQFSTPVNVGGGPWGIAAGPDGALWFTRRDDSKIGRITTAGAGTATSYGPLATNANPEGIVAAPDGALWFTERGADRIGRISTSGTIDEFGPVPTGAPAGIAQGVDGNLWFTQYSAPGALGRITLTGGISEVSIPTGDTRPLGIVTGSDGAIWFAESSKRKLGRTTTGPGVEAAASTTSSDTTATLRGAVNPAGQATTYYFEYGPTTAYGSATTAGSVTGSSAVNVSASVSGLLPETAYHYRLVAVNGTDTTYGPDRELVTKAAQLPLLPEVQTPTLNQTVTGPAPAPVLGQTVVVGATQGVVKLKLAGTKTFVPLTGSVSVPTGSEIDTTKGVVTLVSALDTRGHSQAGSFDGGRFKVKQSKTGKGMTDLYLSGPKPGRCSAPNRASASKVAKKRKRSLWGKDNKGRFRTHGADSVATVRGTRWLTEDRCDGTLTRVTEGAVVVRELHRKRSKVVRAGHSYLARRR